MATDYTKYSADLAKAIKLIEEASELVNIEGEDFGCWPRDMPNYTSEAAEKASQALRFAINDIKLVKRYIKPQVKSK